MGIEFSVPGDPVPFARAGGGKGRHRFTPKKQTDYMTAVRFAAQREMDTMPPFIGALWLHISAQYLVPQSWSKKRKATAVWKTSKPDADNIAKLVKDAITSIVYRDDAQVSILSVNKRYGPQAKLLVRVEPLEEAGLWHFTEVNGEGSNAEILMNSGHG